MYFSTLHNRVAHGATTLNAMTAFEPLEPMPELASPPAEDPSRCRLLGPTALVVQGLSD